MNQESPKAQSPKPKASLPSLRVVDGIEVNGRVFDRVPRLLQSASEDRGVVFFHSRDNPFGNPYEVWNTYKNDSKERIKERLYGIAYRQHGARFRKFHRKVHVIDPSQIPIDGVNRHICDPAKGRNYCSAWIRQTPDAHYLYREFPNQVDYIEGVGVMGPWAIPDGKKADGRMGEAQSPVGWGLLDYCEMWAKAEQWPEDWETRLKYFGYKSEEQPIKRSKLQKLTGGQVEGRRLDCVDQGSKERVVQRICDSRAATEPKTNQENMRFTTIQSEFEELGVMFDLAAGSQIAVGVNLIVNALAYDEGEPISFENCPNLYISSDCLNSIFALETWTGEDGNKGACKDYIDLLRYYFESKPLYDERLAMKEGWNAGVRARSGSPY